MTDAASGGGTGFQLVLVRGKKELPPLAATGREIVIGTRSSCTITLDDVMVSERHCAIQRRPDGFALKDLGTPTGTYLNGVPVVEPTPVKSGDVVVIGASRMRILHGDEAGGDATIRVELQESSFFFKTRDKKDFARDADQWVESEVAFGRWRTLRVTNVLALCSTIVVAGLVVSTRPGEALLEPGQLHSVHAAALRASGCGACHTPFLGTPAERCATCHADVVSGGRHALGQTLAAGLADASGTACTACHAEHFGETRTTPEAAETCATCHTEDELDPDWMRRRLASSQASTEPRVVEVRYDSFSHASHRAVGCTSCHEVLEVPEAEAPGKPRREFAPVTFADCMGCHDARPEDLAGSLRRPDVAALERPQEHRFTTTWHGAGASEATCTLCHDRAYEGGPRETAYVETGPLTYRLRTRSHAEHFVEQRCVDCHLAGIPSRRFREAAFLHALHVTDPRPAPDERRLASAECIDCHTELIEATELARVGAGPGHYEGPGLQSCGQCHREGDEPLLSLATRDASWPSASGRVARSDEAFHSGRGEDAETRRRVDFPHKYHLGERLEGGCFACHELPAGSAGFESPVLTRPEAADCASCHADHREIAGGSCSACHGLEDERWSPAASPFRNGRRLKPWPASGTGPSRFRHASRGHRELTESSRCQECHLGTEDAQTVFDVPIPGETDAACIDCHVLERQRYHW